MKRAWHQSPQISAPGPAFLKQGDLRPVTGPPWACFLKLCPSSLHFFEMHTSVEGMGAEKAVHMPITLIIIVIRGPAHGECWAVWKLGL